MTTTHLLYLHGFRSSPQSTKARCMAAWIAANHPHIQWWCPQLPPSPRAAAALIEEGTREWPGEHMAVVGSSLGGYYATWLAEQRACRAVLLNPAVEPARDLAHSIGDLTQWQDPEVHLYFRHEYLKELRALAAGPLAAPKRYCVFVARGDEVLDWREAAARYAGTELHLLPGGDHALSSFPGHLPTIARFLGLTV